MEINMSSASKLAPHVAVQHVTKASSEELLKKFAQEGSQSDLKKELKLAIKRRRHNITTVAADRFVDSPSSRRASWPEKRSLLPIGKRRVVGRSRSVRDFKNKSIFGTIQKTWRRTVEGASKVFVEKHFYNRHKRLINDPLC